MKLHTEDYQLQAVSHTADSAELHMEIPAALKK
jgi:hypothetical protein